MTSHRPSFDYIIDPEKDLNFIPNSSDGIAAQSRELLCFEMSALGRDLQISCLKGSVRLSFSLIPLKH